MEDADSPPKKYEFKERSFKRDNAPSSAHPPMPTAKELAIMAGPVTRTTPKTTGAKPGDPNDVHVVLQDNLAKERQAGLDQVEIREVKSRRRRDYWLIMIASESVMGTVTVLGRDNPMTFVCGLAAMVLIGVSITWIMWQIMDRY